MISRLVTEFILFKVFLVFFQFCKLLTVFALCLIIALSSNRYKTFFEKESFSTKIGYSVFENVRYNIRIILGSFIPLAPGSYSGITELDKKTLPNPKKAAFKFDSHQNYGIAIIRQESLMFEDLVVALYTASKTFYKEHGWNNLRSNPLKISTEKIEENSEKMM